MCQIAPFGVKCIHENDKNKKEDNKMDAITYFKERERMLNSFGRKAEECIGISCLECPFGADDCLYHKVEGVRIVERMEQRTLA